ncbi:transposase, partial [Listeria fleischmannii subsp. coloradonensis]
YTWVRKYNHQGLDGLQDLRGRRKEKETLTEIEQLRLENKQLKERARFLEMEQDIVKKLRELHYKNRPFH